MLSGRIGARPVPRFCADTDLDRGGRSLRPHGSGATTHQVLDELKRNIAIAVVARSMLGRDERSNRLRQSPPYVGMLPREEVRRLNEEAAA